MKLASRSRRLGSLAGAAFLLGIAAFIAARAAESRYELAGEGVVRDRQNKLDWARTDNGRDVNWMEAGGYCRELTIAGGGWRLPTSAELQGLADPQRSDRTDCSVNGARFTCIVPSLFRLSSPAHWTSEIALTKTGMQQAWAVHLIGQARIYDPLDQRGHQRALCVRSRSDAEGSQSRELAE
jgi:hypothetical protein